MNTNKIDQSNVNYLPAFNPPHTLSATSHALDPSITKIEKSAAIIIPHLEKAFDFTEVIDKAQSKEVKILLNFLISCETPSAKDLSWKLLSSLLIKKDKAILQESRKVLQDIFFEVFKRLQEVKPNSNEEKLYEIFLADLLTTYPFFEPHYETAPTLSLPQKIKGKWVYTSYDVKPIQLGEEWMKPPLYAYGLKAQDARLEAHPLLLFMGTPPPSTTGEAIAKWADFIPGHTVGELLYDLSKESIEGWIDEANLETGKSVKMYGKSLGGALCLLSSVHCGNKVEAYAFNPPGLDSRMDALYKRNLKKWQLSSPPLIHIFSQKNDLVSELIGVWPKSAKFFQIVPENKVNGYYSHIQSFPGGKKVEVLQLEPKQLNRSIKRKIATVAFHIASCVLVTFNTLGLLFSSLNFFIRENIEGYQKRRQLKRHRL